MNTMERLEGGLTKLKSTSSQVDDLKEKLAAQEIELKQKNEDADKLIQKVMSLFHAFGPILFIFCLLSVLCFCLICRWE